jgi:hypothetical protein
MACLRVFKPLFPLAIRPSQSISKEDITEVLSTEDVFVTISITQLPNKSWVGELEDGKGWVPLFLSEGNRLLVRSMPIERGMWTYTINNPGGLALRSRPDYHAKYAIPQFMFSNLERIYATHRVVGAHNSVYVRVSGYNGWLFESRIRNGEVENTLLPAGIDQLTGSFTTVDPVMNLEFASQTQAQTQLMSVNFGGDNELTENANFTVEWLRELAKKAELKEMLHSPWAKVICFCSSSWPTTVGSYRINVFYNTSTVGTVVILPRSGNSGQSRTQYLYPNVTREELKKLYKDPCYDIEREYSSLPERSHYLLSSLQPLFWEFDFAATAFADAEERRRLRELEDRERKRKDARGRYEVSWLNENMRSFLQNSCDMSNLKRMCFLSKKDVILSVDDAGVASWAAPLHGSLASLLKSGSSKAAREIDLISTCPAPDGSVIYYLKFVDGSYHWEGLPEDLVEIICREKVLDIALGVVRMSGANKMWKGRGNHGNNTSTLSAKSDEEEDSPQEECGWRLQFILKTTRKMYFQIDSIHPSWICGDLEFFSLGPNGQYFLLHNNDKYALSQIGREQFKEIQRLKREGSRITQIYFGCNSTMVIRYAVNPSVTVVTSESVPSAGLIYF